MGAAAEAVVELLVGTHPERRRLLVVERAAGLPLAAGLLELHAPADQLDDVGARDQLVEECLWNPARHGQRYRNGQSGKGWPALQPSRRSRSKSASACPRPSRECSGSTSTSPARAHASATRTARSSSGASPIASGREAGGGERTPQQRRDLARAAAAQVTAEFLHHHEVGPRGGGHRRETVDVRVLAVAGLAEEEREPPAAAQVLGEIDQARECRRVVREVHDEVEPAELVAHEPAGVVLGTGAESGEHRGDCGGSDAETGSAEGGGREVRDVEV